MNKQQKLQKVFEKAKELESLWNEEKVKFGNNPITEEEKDSLTEKYGITKIYRYGKLNYQVSVYQLNNGYTIVRTDSGLFLYNNDNGFNVAVAYVNKAKQLIRFVNDK